MKRLTLIMFCALGALAQGNSVHSVYILPMAGGLDQYLAERITREHAMQVTADPKAANAVLTDHLGEAFEAQMDKVTGKEEKDKDARPAFHSSAAKGTVFLVDAKSRQVLWSDYERPSRLGMDREAERIVKKLQVFGK